MKQKRQTFKKQIRRQALNKIFQKKRQNCFNMNYNFNQPVSQQTLSVNCILSLTQQCESQFSRYSQQLYQALKQNNFQYIYQLTKQAYHFLRKLMKSSENFIQKVRIIIQTWFKYNIDQLIIDIACFYQKINGKNYSAFRREFYIYAIKQYQQIFTYQKQIQIQHKRKSIYHFLFLACQELASVTSSINQICSIILNTVRQSKKAMHQFLFWNSKQNIHLKLITYQNLTFIMFQNREKLINNNYDENNHYQREYLQIKHRYITLFIDFGYQLRYLEIYLNKIQRFEKNKLLLLQSQNINPLQNQPYRQIYQKTLLLYDNPKQIVLKNWLNRQVVGINIDMNKNLRQFYLRNWQKDPQYPQNLAECLQALKLNIQFNSSHKFLCSNIEQLEQYIDLLSLNNFGQVAKQQILALLDIVIYKDQSYQLVEELLKHDIFKHMWAYKYNSSSSNAIKYNILANIVLSPSGYQTVKKYISQIAIQLSGRKQITEILAFIFNYLSYKKFKVSENAADDLIIQLLYSLPIQHYKIQDIQREYQLFVYLYEKGFCLNLPKRYYELEKINENADQTYQKPQNQGQRICKYNIALRLLEYATGLTGLDENSNFMDAQ